MGLHALEGDSGHSNSAVGTACLRGFTGDSTCAIGSYITAPYRIHNSIILGANAVATASNQLVLHGIGSGRFMNRGQTPVITYAPMITNDSQIMLTTQIADGIPSVTYVVSRKPGQSFTTQAQAGDTSTVAWFAFEP